MRRRNAPVEGLSHEFELDLAPLLAVMVKLVPVLIVSSAFVPIVIIQSELPAPVAAAVSEQKPDESPQLELVVHPTQGMDLKLTQAGKNLDQVHMNYPTNLKDLSELKQNLLRVKRQSPQLFRLDLIPQGNVPYELVIKIIDAARKSPVPNEKFKFKNPQSGTLEETDYMYPDVVFANVLEG
jgi:biopolymer transport protein ExbD